MFKDYLFTAEKLRSHIFNQIYLPTCPARQPLLTPPSGIFRQPLPFFPLEFSPGGGHDNPSPGKLPVPPLRIIFIRIYVPILPFVKTWA